MSLNYLVTGATSGIGLRTVEHLLSIGNKVFAIGRNTDSLEYLQRKYTQLIIVLKFDLLQISEIEGQVSIFCEKNGKFDGLVNCAGIEETNPLTLYTFEKINRIFQINTFAAIELLRVFAKKKYSNDGASIVLISSVMGILGQSGKVGYCASKSAVIGAVKASALELAKRNIRVNAVLPGVVMTPMTEKLFEKIDEASQKRIQDMHPLGFGTVEDVVPTIAFLLSDNSKWITGQNIIIDGGYSIQ